jgi:hypothetical protein
MAHAQSVRDYIAQWLQLGKKIIVGDTPVAKVPIRGVGGYTPEFENLWHWLTSEAIAPQAYLSATDQTIAQLLSDRWEIVPCARCDTLIPMPASPTGYCPPCPCTDLPNLPNLDLVLPHPPINSQVQLAQLAERLHSQAEP